MKQHKKRRAPNGQGGRNAAAGGAAIRTSKTGPAQSNMKLVSGAAGAAVKGGAGTNQEGRAAGFAGTLKTLAARPGFFPAACYAVCLAGWLLLGLVALGRDSVARASGSLAPFALEPAALEPVNAVWETGEGEATATLYTLTDDPQLLWQNPDGRKIRTLRFAADYENSPREMCLYYTSAPGEPFSQDKRVFAVPSDDGKSYLYTLPQGSIAALRLDPCSTEDNRVTVSGIALNEPAGALSYLAPGWYGLFQMALWPGLAAVGLELLRQLWGLSGNKKARKNSLSGF